MDALTINVTRLFRDEAMFAAVTRAVVPELWRSAASPINVWSAGCSTGDEAYSLAILFHRYATDLGDASCATRVRVLGSDIDRTSLIAASRGAFRDTAFTETPPELRRAYFGQSPPHAIIPTVRAMVQFERRDLLTDPFPGDQHVICCRNVLIYFSRATQEAFFPRLHAALAPGGFLILGKVETLFGPAQSLFTAVDRRTRVFRRT
jgi:chemotaxis methyl-accepting protein methylase